MKAKMTFLGLFLLFSMYSEAQERSCGMQAHMQEKLQDPEYRQQYLKRQDKFQRELVALRNTENQHRRQTVTIPVAVHFPDGDESNRLCLEALSQTQVDILNDDYKATNSDISNWSAASAEYPSVGTGIIDVEFIIANINHPADTDNDLIEGGKAVTIGYNFGNGGDNDTKWAGYMNFVIKDLGEGFLGYSSLGGDPSIGDTVVMNISAFGSGSGCAGYVPGVPFNLGRTVTHELGHHYNLDHPWADGNCTSDDNVADTPNIDQPSGGCPVAGSVTLCGNKSLTMNYMDYVNDGCMYMFTAGQAERAMAYINTIKDLYRTDVIQTLTNEDFDFKNGFVIYPNPAKNDITIKSKNGPLSGRINIEFIDLLGRSINTLSTESFTKQKINVASLKEGLYLLRISSGNDSMTRKIVVGH